jgi:NADH pyrophosphatase NudC (nudix superfamily)
MVGYKKGHRAEVRRGEKPMKQEELQQVWQERSQEAFVQVAQWQQEHPSATLAEIEETMDRHLMRLRAQLIQEVAQHREVTPASASSPPCPKCATTMQARGTHKRSLLTQGDQHVTLKRTYFVCPDCGYSFFPPG